MAKYRVTGFTRFFLVMLFVVPLAYLGAAWYNGEDGLANIKSWLGIGDPVEKVVEPRTEEPVADPTPERQPSSETTPPVNPTELEYYQRRVEELEAENNRLRERIWELDQELARIRENQ